MIRIVSTERSPALWLPHVMTSAGKNQIRFQKDAADVSLHGAVEKDRNMLEDMQIHNDAP